MLKIKDILFALFIVFFISSCSKRTMIPDVDVSKLDAEQAIMIAQSEIDEAQDVGADVSGARKTLDGARRLFDLGSYAKAKKEADKAANTARELKQGLLGGVRIKEDAEAAIERAEGIISEVKYLGADVSGSEGILLSAKEKYNNKSYKQAIELADQAYDLAKEQLGYMKMDKYTVGTWEADRDCLWNIAKKKSIYNDAWKWKRIYIANKDKLKSPNLIYPKQILRIPKN
ncbi:LysM peptidoglycan-binding domain-containing protein [Elusimicrobiota bacterium]